MTLTVRPRSRTPWTAPRMCSANSAATCTKLTVAKIRMPPITVRGTPASLAMQPTKSPGATPELSPTLNFNQTPFSSIRGARSFSNDRADELRGRLF